MVNKNIPSMQKEAYIPDGVNTIPALLQVHSLKTSTVVGTFPYKPN
jgi:hypothetical protein